MNNHYHTHEGILKLPANWIDETSIALVWPQMDDSSSPFSLTIEKDPINHNDLTSYVNEQIHELEDELDDFREIARNELTIDNQTAIEVKFSWYSDDDEKIVQRQAFVLYNGTVFIFNGTMMDRFDAEGEKKWKLIIDNFTFRKDDQ